MKKLGTKLENLRRSIHARMRSAEALAALRAAWKYGPIGLLCNCPAYDKPSRGQPWCESDAIFFYMRICIERTEAVHRCVFCHAL